MTLNTRATQKRQMRDLLREYRRNLCGILQRCAEPPVYVEEAMKALNIAEASLRDRLDYAGFITACNIAGDAIIKHANEVIEARKATA